MRIVLDTNVIISALMFNRQPEQVLHISIGVGNQLVLSRYIIVETLRVLENRFRVSPGRLSLFEQWLNELEVVYFRPFLHVVKDEPDNRVIETAIKGNAEYIITGDKLLLGLQKFEQIEILDVKSGLKVIAGHDD